MLTNSVLEKVLTKSILSNSQKSLVINNKLRPDKNTLKNNKLDYLIKFDISYMLASDICKAYIPLTSCPTEYEVMHRMGENSVYGEIWNACCEKDCRFILKWQKYTGGDLNKSFIENEIKMQNIFAELNVSIPITDSWFCDDGGIIIMPALKYTLRYLLDTNDAEFSEELIYESLGMLDFIHESGYAHGDPHLNNIMSDGDRLYLIDMGSAGVIKSDEDYYYDYEVFIDDLRYYTDNIVTTADKMLLENARNYIKKNVSEKDKVLLVYQNYISGLQYDKDIYEKIKVTDLEILEKNKEKLISLEKLIEKIVNDYGL
jgi:tRNA A-37 threonylcarbamoyl transferase component Bud32